MKGRPISTSSSSRHDGQVLGASTAAAGSPALARPGSAESQRIVTADAGVLGEVRVLTPGHARDAGRQRRRGPVRVERVGRARPADAAPDRLRRRRQRAAGRPGVVRRRPGAAPGRRDAADRRPRSATAICAAGWKSPATGDELDRSGRHAERAARAARGRRRPRTSVRRRREPRAAHADRGRAGAARDRAGRSGWPSSTPSRRAGPRSTTSRTWSTSCWCWPAPTTASAMYPVVRSTSTSSCSARPASSRAPRTCGSTCPGCREARSPVATPTWAGWSRTSPATRRVTLRRRSRSPCTSRRHRRAHCRRRRAGHPSGRPRRRSSSGSAPWTTPARPVIPRRPRPLDRVADRGAHHGTIRVDDAPGGGRPVRGPPSRRRAGREPSGDRTGRALNLRSATPGARRASCVFSLHDDESARSTDAACRWEPLAAIPAGALDVALVAALAAPASRRPWPTAEPSSGQRSVADSDGARLAVYGHDHSNTRAEPRRAHRSPRDGRPAGEGLGDRRISSASRARRPCRRRRATSATGRATVWAVDGRHRREVWSDPDRRDDRRRARPSTATRCTRRAAAPLFRLDRAHGRDRVEGRDRTTTRRRRSTPRRSSSTDLVLQGIGQLRERDPARTSTRSAGRSAAYDARDRARSVELLHDPGRRDRAAPGPASGRPPRSTPSAGCSTSAPATAAPSRPRRSPTRSSRSTTRPASSSGRRSSPIPTSSARATRPARTPTSALRRTCGRRTDATWSAPATRAATYHALDRDTGEVVWETQLTPGSVFGGEIGSAAFVDGRLVASSNVGDPRPTRRPTSPRSSGSIPRRARCCGPRRSSPEDLRARSSAVPGVAFVGTDTGAPGRARHATPARRSGRTRRRPRRPADRRSSTAACSGATASSSSAARARAASSASGGSGADEPARRVTDATRRSLVAAVAIVTAGERVGRASPVRRRQQHEHRRATVRPVRRLRARAAFAAGRLRCRR